jgi:hypothetical protein
MKPKGTTDSGVRNSVGELGISVQPKHLSRIPAAVIALGAPEEILELVQESVLAEAPHQRRRAHHRGVPAALASNSIEGAGGKRLPACNR